MMARQQLLQELDTASDEMLTPILEFLRVLKAHPHIGADLNSVLAKTFELLEKQPSYDKWLADVQSKVTALGVQAWEK